jgi:hypothetical protein
LLLEFLLFAALLLGIWTVGWRALCWLLWSCFAALAALLLGIPCGLLVLSALVHRWTVGWRALYWLLWSCFAALAALLLL